MEKSQNSRRRRRAPSEPQLTSPLSPGGGGGGGVGGDYIDRCPGPDEGHHHQHHTTNSGLAQHLKLYFRHNWPERLVSRHGFELVMKVLDELTETYGPLLDAPPVSYRQQGHVYVGSRSRPEPEIKNPAGFINRMVEMAAEEQETYFQEQRRRLRVVGDSY